MGGLNSRNFPLCTVSMVDNVLYARFYPIEAIDNRELLNDIVIIMKTIIYCGY